MKSSLACQTSPVNLPVANAYDSLDHAVPSEASPIGVSQSIARDLHDSFPQEFQAVIMHLRVALEASTCADAKHHVEQAMSAAQTGLNCVRTLVRALRSGSPSIQPAEPQRLIDVVADSARCALKTHHVRFHLINRITDLNIDAVLAAQISMMVREATHNAVKHGAPSLITCQVIESGPAITVEIKDDGRGFDQESVVSGFGLLGMRERAAAINATLTVISQIGRGCAIRLTFARQALLLPVQDLTLHSPQAGASGSYVPPPSDAADENDPANWGDHSLAVYLRAAFASGL